MSKASDWARAKAFPNLITTAGADLTWHGTRVIARVVSIPPPGSGLALSILNRDGRPSPVALGADDALALARWMLEIFGDPLSSLGPG